MWQANTSFDPFHEYVEVHTHIFDTPWKAKRFANKVSKSGKGYYALDRKYWHWKA